HQRFEIADRLRAAENAEAEFFAGERKLAASAAGELEEDTVVAAAFVKLSGRMQESRSVSGRRGDVQLARDRLANFRDPLVVLRRFSKVLGERDVVACLHFREE